MLVVACAVMVVSMTRATLTGRLSRHSTTGLAGVATALPPRADLRQVVPQQHLQLGADACVVCLPVGVGSTGAWPGRPCLLGIRHACCYITRDAPAVRPCRLCATGDPSCER